MQDKNIKNEHKHSSPLPSHLAKGAIAWMACNPVAANLLMFFLLIGGLMMSMGVQKDIYPEFALSEIKISVSYSGATPEEIEKSIVRTIEQAIEDVDDVIETEATITSGSASLKVQVDQNADGNKVLQDVKAEIDRITTFPEGAEEPSVSLSSTSWKVMTLLLTGTDDLTALNYWANIIKDELSQTNEISSVMLEGMRDMEIHVEISQDTLIRYGLTLHEVSSIISKSAIEQGGGTLKTSGGDIMIRLDEKREYAAEFADIAIRTNPDGSQLLLEDIAIIKDGFEDVNSWSEFDGQPSVSMNVFKTAEQDPIIAVDVAMEVLNRLNDTLPADITINIRDVSADIYKDNQALLLSNALTGILLVFICLGIFLRPSLALWVSLGIPISVIGAFWFFEPFGISINMLSMFAFIITLGVVVDDAIIVGENVSAWQERGVSPLEAAVRGVKGVSIPVIFSVLTNIVAFLPILFVPGTVGKALSALPIVVIVVLSCSLIESLFILPAHLAHVSKKTQKDKSSKSLKNFFLFENFTLLQENFSKKFLYFAKNHFGSFLNTSLTHRYITLCIGTAIMLVTIGFVASGRMGFELVPRTDADFASATIIFPSDASITEIEEMKAHLEDAAQRVINENGGDTLARGMYTNVSGNKNEIHTRVFLQAPDVRPITTTEFTEKWRVETGVVAGAENTQMSSDEGNFGSGKGLSIRLFHRNNEVLDEAALTLGTLLSSYAEISDIGTGVSQSKREFDIKLLPIAKQLGFSAQDLSLQVRSSFEGSIALRQQREHNEITVRVLLPEEERNELASFENLIVRSPGGQEVLLRDIIEINDTQADSVIRHADGRRTASVSANITPTSATATTMSTVQNDIMPRLMSSYPGLSWEFSGQQNDMQGSITTMIYGLLFSLFGIYALLAIPFKSYTQPIIVMMAIPFGVVGAVFGHFIMEYSISVISIFGIVALSGVVVNDSLVLINFADLRREEGASPFDSIHQAAIQRFRPIILTTLTTFVGLVPIIFETSRQARMMVPMALSLGFGILFATVICLFIIPSLYLVLEDIKELCKATPKQVDEKNEEGLQNAMLAKHEI